MPLVVAVIDGWLMGVGLGVVAPKIVYSSATMPPSSPADIQTSPNENVQRKWTGWIDD